MELEQEFRQFCGRPLCKYGWRDADDVSDAYNWMAAVALMEAHCEI